MAASWEISHSRQNRILLATVCPPDLEISLDFAEMKRYIQLPPGSDYMRVEGLPWGPARNRAARTALDNGYHLAFLDADLRVQPDAFRRLFATGLDMVSGLYFQRYWPYFPVAFNEAQDSQGNSIRVPVTGWRPWDVFPCTFIPTGLVIYRRRVLEALFARYPRPFEWGLDVAPVPSEDGPARPYSEDFTASFRARALGFQGYVNAQVVGLHEVLAVIGPKWMVPMPSPEPLHGVLGAA